MDEILKIKELSDYLKIPSSTIYKLIQEGKLPAIKLGKHWRILKRDIENLFEKQTLIKSMESGVSNEYKG
jgi:excisionase family DNA binding protein